MTLNELKRDTAALGFEKEIELDESFIGAVNRALLQIFTERREKRIMRVFPKEPSLSLFKKTVIKRGKEKIAFSAEGAGFAFFSFGTGKLTLEDGFGKRSFDFSGEGALTRGFIKGEAFFILEGDFSYTLTDLSVYKDLRSEEQSDLLPLPLFNSYDGEKYDARFNYFSSAPFDDDGNVLRGCEVKGKKLYIKVPHGGAVNIEYTLKAPRLSPDAAEENIDLPEGTEHLLSLLCAHYVWLDDDFTKAQHYLSLYRDGMSALKYYSREFECKKYETNGWA